jgi:hypothetical protein
MSWLWGKLQGYLAIAGALILAVAYAFLRGRASGKSATLDTINTQTHKLDDKFRKIDSSAPDLDASLGRLRDRNKKR